MAAYASGPIADPCIMVAFMLSNSGVWPQNDMECECHVKKSLSQLCMWSGRVASFGGKELSLKVLEFEKSSNFP